MFMVWLFFMVQVENILFLPSFNLVFLNISTECHVFWHIPFKSNDEGSARFSTQHGLENTEWPFYSHRSRKWTRMQCSNKTSWGLTKAGLALLSLNGGISELRFPPTAHKIRAKRNMSAPLRAAERLSGKCERAKSIWGMWVHQKVAGTLPEFVPDWWDPTEIRCIIFSPPLLCDLFQRSLLLPQKSSETRFLSCPVTSQKTVFIRRSAAALVPHRPTSDGLFIQKGSLQAGQRALHGRAENS